MDGGGGDGYSGWKLGTVALEITWCAIVGIHHNTCWHGSVSPTFSCVRARGAMFVRVTSFTGGQVAREVA